MRNVLVIICTLISIQVAAQYPGYKPQANIDEFKKQFSKAAQATQSIQCEFVQDKNLSMIDDKIVSTGKFWFKRRIK